MILIVGLGNPGKKYEKTRHNIGFLALDELSKKRGFKDWKENKSINCFFTRKDLANKDTELIKPSVFMNNSGSVVKSILKKHNLKPENVFIIHDDIDLPLGKMRIVQNRGSAGHKGVESIIKELKTNSFIRIRIGIQPKFGKPKNPEKFVLENFSKEEGKIIREVIKKTAKAVEILVSDGLERTMNQYNE